jgi:hypothetical protein
VLRTAVAKAALIFAVLIADGAPTTAAVDPPARASVLVRLPAASEIATTGVAWRAGRAWFAVAVDRELRIYRWQLSRWVLDGTVALPSDMPPPVPGGSLAFNSLTGAVAPDFTAHVYGADTLWFAIAARDGGRWHIVPFDDQFAKRHPYTFASGSAHHLVEGVFDSCGCAGGPTTYQWYRFTPGVFDPTTPPGRTAVCSESGLAFAKHWPVLPDDPLVRDIDRPFHIDRFACADGWALAADAHKVSLYEQLGRRWLRVGVGPPRLVGTRIDFAMARSLLDRLGRRIGVRFPAAAPERPGVQLPARTRWQRAPINVRVRPADTYLVSNLFDGPPKVLTITIHSSVGATRILRFRWRNGAWPRIR